MCYSFNEDPITVMDKSVFKEEYRLLFDEMREYYKNLRVVPRRRTTVPVTRELTLKCIKSRSNVQSNNNYHYN